MLIAPGETIWTGDGRQLRVIDLVLTDDEADSKYVGLLRVAAT